MKLDPKRYDRMVRLFSPPSRLGADCLWAFLVGGGICLLGEVLRCRYLRIAPAETAGALTSITLIGLAAAATLPGWYQKLAAHAGAGTLVPVTGFSNSVASAAMEFKSEGWVTGAGAQIFSIAGPVITYGTLASWVWGLLYWVMNRGG